MNHIYRVTELVGSSPTPWIRPSATPSPAPAKTLRHLDWFEVTEVRGHLVDGEIGHFQVGLKVGFRVESPDRAG